MLCVFFLVVVVGEGSVDEARDAREDVAQRRPRVEAVDAPLGVRERERVDARPAPPWRRRRLLKHGQITAGLVFSAVNARGVRRQRRGALQM